MSSLVPSTVSSVSLLAKSAIAGLQIWALHGLLLTIEASGFSYVSHVQVIESVSIVLASNNGFSTGIYYIISPSNFFHIISLCNIYIKHRSIWVMKIYLISFLCLGFGNFGYI